MIFPFWGKALVLDLDDFKDRKIVFAIDHFDCLGVYFMKLEDDGTPSSIERVDSYDMTPDVDSYTLSHLGDGKVCFVTSLCYDAGVQFIITTFEFSCIQRKYATDEEPIEEPAMKRRTVEVLPRSDRCSSDDGGSSSDVKVFIKLLGELWFDYSWTEWTERTKRESWTEWSEPPKRVHHDEDLGGRLVISGASSVF